MADTEPSYALNSITPTVRICLAFTLLLISGWVLNTYLYPAIPQELAYSKSIATLTAGVIGLLFTYLAVTRPALFREPFLSAAAFTAVMTATVCMRGGTLLTDPLFTTLGATLLSIANVWMGILLCMALMQLPRFRVLVALVVAFCLRHVAPLLLGALPSAPLNVLILVNFVLMYALVFPYLKTPFTRIVEAPAQHSLSVTNPGSYLPFSSHVFLAILIFSVANGFAITFSAENGTPQQLLFAFIPFLVLLTIIALRRRPLSTDSLYLTALLLVLAGFLLVPAIPQTGTQVAALANTLLKAGSDMFWLMMYFLLAVLAARNPLAAISLFAFSSAARSFGTEIGAQLGSLVSSYPSVTALLLAAVIFCFIAYNLFLMHNTRFEAIIAGIMPVVPVKFEVENAGADQLTENCQKVATAYSLTAREAEVLELLARGRNAQVIQDKLVVSYATAKSHVHNIYSKTNVHSQQELIDLVDASK